MNIKVGKMYVRRDGIVTGAMVRTKHHLFILRDPDAGLSYTAEGSFLAGDRQDTSDLVEEHIPGEAVHKPVEAVRGSAVLLKNCDHERPKDVTREEFDELKQEVDNLKKILRRAGKKHCTAKIKVK